MALTQVAARIVPLTEKHLEGFRDALDIVARERKYLAITKAFPAGATRRFVLANIKAGNPAFVALVARRVVGWADIQRVARDTMQHVGVLGIGIVPEFRGQGIGRLLMERAVEDAWAHGFTRIELTVREDNERAAALYRSLGFQHEGVRRSALLVEGRHYDLVAMALLRE